MQSRLRTYLAFFYDSHQHFYSLLRVELVTNVHLTFVSDVVSCPNVFLSAFRHILLDLFFQRALCNMQLTTVCVL